MTRRLPELDGVRGIAVLLILVWHYIACQLQAPMGTWGATFLQSLALTWGGVDLFFVLSGFLIVGILLDVKGGSSYYKTFYIRRACRILPLYGVLLATFLVITRLNLVDNTFLFAEKLPLWSYFTFTQNFFIAYDNEFGPAWLGITWSLAIEEQFYLLIPFFVAFLSRTKLLTLFALAIVAAPILRIKLDSYGGYVLPFTRSDSILLGGALAVVLRHPPAMVVLKKYYLVVLAGFVLILAGTFVLAFNNCNAKDIWGIGDPVNHLCLALLSASVLLLAVGGTNNIIGKLLRNRVLVWFGLRSYSIYLFHMAIAGLFHHWAGRGQPFFSFKDPKTMMATGWSLLALLILAEVSFRFFESPILKFGHKFRYGDEAYPRRFYAYQDISDEMIDQAVRNGEIQPEHTGAGEMYNFNEMQAKWPHLEDNW